jgi:catechol 2,3-dioxygenase-like lactoylglutathione lyase family enzyme
MSAPDKTAASRGEEPRPMKVLGIVWTGVQTERFDAMATFMEGLIGTDAARQEPGFRFWGFPDGDILELFAGGTKPPFENAPVVGFRVDDLEAGRQRLTELGAEILGTYGPNADGYGAIHFRAPDGNIYELTYDPDHETRGDGRRLVRYRRCRRRAVPAAVRRVVASSFAGR